MRKILVFDNYDSFTYNLVHFIKELTRKPVDVFRNDEIPLDAIEQYEKIVLSPGPGIPEEAGELIPLVKRYAATKSILGVCLGHQAIAEALGGSLENMTTVYHGIADTIIKTDKNEMLFNKVADRFEAGRYHSWVVRKDTLPDCFKITAEDTQGRIMAISHKKYDVKGVQFHPESVLTKDGEQMIANWLIS